MKNDDDMILQAQERADKWMVEHNRKAQEVINLKGELNQFKGAILAALNVSEKDNDKNLRMAILTAIQMVTNK